MFLAAFLLLAARRYGGALVPFTLTPGDPMRFDQADREARL